MIYKVFRVGEVRSVGKQGIRKKRRGGPKKDVEDKQRTFRNVCADTSS